MLTVFIVHGNKRSAKRVISRLRKLLPSVQDAEVVFTSHKGHATKLAARYALMCELLVAVGGDGLLNECINGIMQAAAMNTGSAPPALGLFPCGSGNDFARNFGWKSEVQSFVSRLADPVFVRCDIGEIKYQTGDRFFFLNEASMGLSMAVVQRVEKLPANWPGGLKFGYATLCAFLSYRSRFISIRGAGFHWQGNAMLVVCANGKFFGSGIGIAPGADVSDGMLEIVVVGDVSWVDYLLCLPQLRRGQRLSHPGVHYFTVSAIEILSENPLECDGEVAGFGPATINCGHSIALLN